MSEHKGILVYGEVVDGKLSTVVPELLGVGRKLADARNEQLSVVLIDKQAKTCAGDAVKFGADHVYVIEDAPTDTYEGSSHTAMIENICKNTVNPAIILLGQTINGRDLAPRLAFRFDAGLTMDCTKLDIDPESKKLLAGKPVAGGNVIATYSMKDDRIQMATTRRKAMEPLVPDESRQAEVTVVPAGIDSSVVKATIINTIKEESEGPDLENADVVVTGGRGVGTPEEFETHITNGLANILGAAVGGTRAAVDFGLVPEQQQVGLTGKIVGPTLYLAVALSGAIQHITGCAGSKNIVAINKDENAQIFNFSRFGIVGDYKKVLPPLIERLNQILAD